MCPTALGPLSPSLQVSTAAAMDVKVVLGPCRSAHCRLQSAAPHPITLPGIPDAVTVSDFCGQLASQLDLPVDRLTVAFGKGKEDRVHIAASGSPPLLKWHPWVRLSRGNWEEAPRSYFPFEQGLGSVLHLGVGGPGVEAIACTCGHPGPRDGECVENQDHL